MITSVFVYGTLKRGQCREHHWPVAPRHICSGWTRGMLFGRADFPAMTAGPDCVRGELWTFDAEQIAGVLEVLDEVEGTAQPGQPDLYQRVVTEVVDEHQCSLGEAWTYHYATDPQPDGFERILPLRNQNENDNEFNHGPFVQWPTPGDQVP